MVHHYCHLIYLCEEKSVISSSGTLNPTVQKNYLRFGLVMFHILLYVAGKIIFYLYHYSCALFLFSIITNNCFGRGLMRDCEH